jgi:hypothetical protein
MEPNDMAMQRHEAEQRVDARYQAEHRHHGQPHGKRTHVSQRSPFLAVNEETPQTGRSMPHVVQRIRVKETQELAGRLMDEQLVPHRFVRSQKRRKKRSDAGA